MSAISPASALILKVICSCSERNLLRIGSGSLAKALRYWCSPLWMDLIAVVRSSVFVLIGHLLACVFGYCFVKNV